MNLDFNKPFMTHCRTMEDRRELILLMKDKDCYHIDISILEDIDKQLDFNQYPIVKVYKYHTKPGYEVNLYSENAEFSDTDRLLYNQFVSILDYNE